MWASFSAWLLMFGSVSWRRLILSKRMHNPTTQAMLPRRAYVIEGEGMTCRQCR